MISSIFSEYGEDVVAKKKKIGVWGEVGGYPYRYTEGGGRGRPQQNDKNITAY